MNSRERMLSAIFRQPVDHPPFYLRLWSMGEGVDNIPFCWRDQVCRAEHLVKLGLDDTLLLEPPLGYVEQYDANLAPGIAVTTTPLHPAQAGEYPQLRKLYHTPAGDLSTTVKVTGDWPHGNDIMLFSDFNVPRLVEPLIKAEDDIPRLKYLLADPTPEQMTEFRQRAGYLRQQADRLEVLLDGGWTALGDAVIWLCGMQNVLYWQMDRPEFLEALLDVLLEWEMKRLDLLLEEKIEALVHMAWYEGSDFWTPKNYRRMLKPRLRQLVERAHAGGVPVRYIITKGWKPLRQDLLEIGVDCITGVDPVQDRVDLAEVKRELGGRMCLMGGVNAAVMLTQWSDEQIRAAMDEAVQTLAPGGGFILFPVDNVFCELPWERVMLMVRYWAALNAPS